MEKVVTMKDFIKDSNKVVSRKEIPIEFCWDIESLYTSKQEWGIDCQKAEGLRNRLIKCKKNFVQVNSSFLECLMIKDEISKLIQKIYTYASMRRDEDNRDEEFQSIYERASNLLVKIEKSLSFIEPGILSIDRDRFEEWMIENNQLRVYQHYIENIYRKKEHILSPKEERIIAQAGEIAMVPENSFNMLNHTDLEFSRVKDKEGKDIDITHGNFISLLRKKDQNFRSRVFKKYYQPYIQHRHTFSALLSGNLKKDRFFSNTRKYNSSLESALFEDNIPVSVYKNLISITHKNIHLLQKYIQLKKEFLQLKSFHMYDIHVPLSGETTYIPYQEAQNIIIRGLAPLGKPYLSIIQDGFRKRWIDVYENKGKTSGAYSSGTYRSKPFILLNYQGTLEDVYTLAHELGHSLHSYYANNNQPFIYSGYSVFLAEIASTTNESLLTHYLLNHAHDKKEKLTILNHFLEQYRTTLFRQVMFAEFEKMIHEQDERGDSITSEWLSKQYLDLIYLYYGNNIVIDKEISLEWARIPHFYYHYYVYQYVTGFTAAIAISRKILQEREIAVNKYINFLSKGSSDYPMTVLKDAGIDMTNSQPLKESMGLLQELLVQLENLKN